jgi:hypothetical protein
MHGFKEFMMAQEAFTGGAPNVAPAAQTRQNLNTMRNDLQQGMQQPQQGFFAGIRQGAQSGWNRGQGQFTTGLIDDSQIKQYGEAAQVAIAKASEVYNKIEKSIKSWGIDPKLALIILASASTGGASTVPFAVLKYYASKKAGDVAKEKLKNVGNQQPGNVAPGSPQPTNEIFTAQSRGKLGYALGYGAGFLGGEAKTIGGKVVNILKSKAGQLVNWAKENKVDIAKAALLAAISVATGTAVGIGVGVLNDAGAVDALGSAVVDSGLASQQEVAPLINSLHHSLPSVNNAISGVTDPSKFMTGGSLSMAGNIATDPLMKLGINAASAFK